MRPNSIHTLNSGNPQELATGGYESPIDNRHSYPAASAPQQQIQIPLQDPHQPQHQPYDPSYAQQREREGPPPNFPSFVSQQPSTKNDRDALPSARQRTQSFESPTSQYSQPTTTADPSLPAYSAGGQGQGQGQPPPHPLAAPPGVPGSPGEQQYHHMDPSAAPYQQQQQQQQPLPQQAYQAYQPQSPRVGSGRSRIGLRSTSSRSATRNASSSPTTSRGRT